MHSERSIADIVYGAKQNLDAADALIRQYMPFIRSETSKFLNRQSTEQDDETSIAMIAFHEAIGSYDRSRGAFLKYAALIIKSRLKDYAKSQARHAGAVSIDEENEDGLRIADTLADSSDEMGEASSLEATRMEIEELGSALSDFGLSFADIALNSPKQQRTLDACAAAVGYAAENPDLLGEMLRTKKLPLSQLCTRAGVERKTLERHRKYVLAMLIIQTNGFEIIRGHLRRRVKRPGGEKQ